MGLFSFTQEIAIDLGTANTIIICDDQVVVDEPSVVAISMADNKIVEDVDAVASDGYGHVAEQRTEAAEALRSALGELESGNALSGFVDD